MVRKRRASGGRADGLLTLRLVAGVSEQMYARFVGGRGGLFCGWAGVFCGWAGFFHLSRVAHRANDGRHALARAGVALNERCAE